MFHTANGDRWWMVYTLSGIFVPYGKQGWVVGGLDFIKYFIPCGKPRSKGEWEWEGLNLIRYFVPCRKQRWEHRASFTLYGWERGG